MGLGVHVLLLVQSLIHHYYLQTIFFSFLK